MRTSRPLPSSLLPSTFQEEMQPLNQNYLQDNGPLFALRQMLSVGTWGFMRPPHSAFPCADGIPLMGDVTQNRNSLPGLAGLGGLCPRLRTRRDLRWPPLPPRGPGPRDVPPSTKFFFNNKHPLCAGPPPTLSTHRARCSAGAAQHLTAEGADLSPLDCHIEE